MERVVSMSRRLKFAFATMLVSFPLMNALIWYFFNDLPSELTTWKMPGLIANRYLEAQMSNVSVSFDRSSLMFGFLADMIPTAVVVYGFYTLFRLFRNYESGSIFSIENAKLYRRLATVIFAKALADILYGTLAGLAFTLNAPVGERVALIGFGTSELALIFIGCVVLLVSYVMEQASTLSEEQALTI